MDKLMHRWLHIVAGLIAASLFLCRHAAAQSYTVTNLGTLGGDYLYALAINNSGQVAGAAFTADGLHHAFLWKNGVIADLGSAGSGAQSINNSGQVAGYSIVADGSQHSVIWQNGVMTDLGTLGNAPSAAYGINDSGEVVGKSGTAVGGSHAFLWKNRVMLDLGTLGGVFSCALGINGSGQIVGNAYLSDESEHACLWQNGVMTDLGFLPGYTAGSDACGINDGGQVVGSSESAAGTWHAFFWQNGIMTDLGTLGGSSAAANGVNTAGQAVGYSFTADGAQHACLWQNGVIKDLNALIPAGTGSVLTYASGINDAGQIVGHGSNGAVLLTPYPTANPQTVSVIAGKPTTITLTGTDHNSPPLPLTYAIALGPTHGSLGTLNTSTGVVTYTANANYQGTDSFTFTVSDSNATSSPATVTLKVASDVPTANPQTVSVAHNTAKAITLTGTDPDNLPLTFVITTNPPHGKLSGFSAATGAVTYTPNNNFDGADSFSFTVSNGINTSSAAAVTLMVSPGTPTANPQTVAVAHNTATSITLTGSDPDSPALPLTFAIVAKPTHGTLGTLNTSTGAVTYTPTANYQGSDSFTFTVSNGINTSSAAAVTLKVSPGTPTANPQTVAVAHNTAVSITLTGSDSDSPAMPLTFAIVAKPTHGTLGTLNTSTGAVTYTPTANYQGSDGFTFTVSNGINTSSAAAVTLMVSPGTPTANPQTVAVAHNTATSITLTGSDPDSPALPLTFAIVAKPTHGTLGTLNTSTGAVTYTPTANYQGSDSFTFTVSNGINTSSAAAVTLEVSPGTPTANPQSVAVAHNTAVSITLTGSDSDSPPLRLTFAIATSPGHGSLSGLNPSSGAVTYTPNANFQGSDSFTFTVSNGTNTSSAAKITLTVAPGTPTANPQTVNVKEGTPITITLTGSDPDNPALPLTFAIVTNPMHGTLGKLNTATGTVTYTPNLNFGTGGTITDSFTFTVSNGTNTSAPATVLINVVVKQ